MHCNKNGQNKNTHQKQKLHKTKEKEKFKALRKREKKLKVVKDKLEKSESKISTAFLEDRAERNKHTS